MSKQSQQRISHLPGLLLGAGAFLMASTSWAQAGAQAGANVFPTDVQNIALAQNGGRVVAVSSTIDNDPAFNANNLIDGQVNSANRPKSSPGWASNRFDPIDMETVTLGFKGDSTRRIGKVVLNPTSNVAPERWAKDVEIQVSTESAEGPYRTVSFATLRKANTAQEFKFVPVDARFLRLMFRSNWGSDRAVSLGEVEVYEAIGQSDPIGQIIWQLEGAVGELRKFQQTQFSTGAGATLASEPLSEATVQLIQNLGGAGGGSGAGSVSTGSRNIAALANGGRIADFSSQFVSAAGQGPDAAFSPNNLLDGQVIKRDGTGTSGWSSQGFAPGKQFVTIGFRDDRSKLLSKIVVNPASAQSDLRWARRIEVQVTTEAAKAGPFRTIATINLRPEPVNQEFSIGPVEAKYVRLVFMANGPGAVSLATADPDVNSDRAVSLGEVELYEAPSGSQELDALVKRFDNVLQQLKNVRQTNQTNRAAQAKAATVAGEAGDKTQQS